MRLFHTMIAMCIASFLLMYFGMSTITTNSIADVTNSLSKVYLSIIMSLGMVVVEVMMHDHQYNIVSTRTYVGIFACISLFVFLYKKQFGINDRQYLQEMIEHHSMSLLTSNRILEKSNNYKVAKIAKNILQTQQDEIIEMRRVLQTVSS
jgi:hypothetical protein